MLLAAAAAAASQIGRDFCTLLAVKERGEGGCRKTCRSVRVVASTRCFALPGAAVASALNNLLNCSKTLRHRA